MSQGRNTTTTEETRDAQLQGAKTQGDGSGLAMPQEDDPAGDGHRWSGKTLTPQAEPWGDVEVGGPGHIPTVPTEPRQF